MAEPSVAAGRMGPAAGPDGHGLRRLAGVVRRWLWPLSSAGSSGAAVLVAAGAPRGDRRLQAVIDGLAAVGLPRAATSSGPASTPAGRRRTSASAPTATSCSSRRSAPTSAAPTCCSASTAASSRRDFGDEQPFSLVATRRRARGVRRARRAATSACARRALRAFADGRAERLRPGLRRDRRAGRSIGSTRARSPTTCSPPIWDLVGQLRAAPHRPPRPPPGQHLPRRRRCRCG